MTNQHHTQWAKATSGPLKIENRTGMSTFPLFNTGLEVLATAVRQEEEIKDI